MWKIIAIIFTIGCGVAESISFEEAITFTVFNSFNNGSSFVSNFDTTLTSQGCDPTGNFAIVTHGYLESIQTEWVNELISNLTAVRKGCVIFMDYSHYTFKDYISLRNVFQNISAVLLKKLHQLENEGFSGDNGYGFGFSFGSRLLAEACSMFGYQKMKNLDLCDPAGPLFDFLPTTRDPKEAAKNVQCINTSNNFGTNVYRCHQNWRMGFCGIFQPAAPLDIKNLKCDLTMKCLGSVLLSHNMCPVLYTNAFKNNFYNKNPRFCITSRGAKSVPEGYKMGYDSNRTNAVSGDLFSPTSLREPYTV